MTQRTCFLVFVAPLLGASAFAQQDLNAEFGPIPTWPEDGIIPAEMEGRYVFLDTDAGQMVLAYPADLGRGDASQAEGDIRIERFELNNQVDASLSVDVRLRKPFYTYTYVVSNSAQARQAIRSVLIPTTVFSDDDKIRGPALWNAAVSRSSIYAVRLAVGRPDGVVFSWYPNDPRSARDPYASTIPPGGQLSGFSVTSRLKPGFTLAYIRGGWSPALRGDMPEAVLEQTDPMMQIEFNSQNVVTIGPKFDADSPRPVIVKDFHDGIGRMVDAEQISGDSPTIQRALEVLEKCLETADGDGSLESCGLDSAFAAPPGPGLEADVLNAMRLSLAR